MVSCTILTAGLVSAFDVMPNGMIITIFVSCCLTLRVKDVSQMQCASTVHVQCSEPNEICCVEMSWNCGGNVNVLKSSGNSTLAIMVVTCTMMKGYLEAMLVRQRGVWETVCIELGRIVRQMRFLAQHGQMWNVERRPDIYEAIMAKTITSGRHRISLAMSGVMVAWMTESGSDSTTRSNWRSLYSIFS